LMKHSRTQFKTVSLESYSQILYNPGSYSDSFKSQEAHQQFVSQFAHEVKRWIMTHKRVKHVDS